jgi:hypothetical protein
MTEVEPSPDSSAAPSREKLITSLLLLHFLVILLNVLAHTALTHKLDNLYLWYLNCSGQNPTGWGMYIEPNPLNERFVITVYDTNDPHKSYNHHKITDSRELYLAGMIRYAPVSVQTNLAQSYLMCTKKHMNLSAHRQVVLNCYTYVIDPETGMRRQVVTSWELDPEQP